MKLPHGNTVWQDIRLSATYALLALATLVVPDDCVEGSLVLRALGGLPGGVASELERQRRVYESPGA